MLDIHSLIARLKRPRLLVRAARFGIDDYRREKDLPRTLEKEVVPRPGDAIIQLIGLEEELNALRMQKSANYSISKHIDVLTAIMSEARTFQETRGPIKPIS